VLEIQTGPVWVASREESPRLGCRVATLLLALQWSRCPCCSPARITRTAASCACVTSGATLPLVSPQTRRTTVATPKRCLYWDGKTAVSKDINTGCTDKIKAGELVVKDWVDPPLHLVCSKREWRKAID
ncbi:unnamed protein product, partial [Pylaiella littoralis]